MTNFTWTISCMNCYPQAEGHVNVVCAVHWSCEGIQTVDNENYTANAGNTCAVKYISGNPYTPYSELTQDQVLGWIWANGVDKSAVEANVQTILNNNINPPLVSPALPW